MLTKTRFETIAITVLAAALVSLAGASGPAAASETHYQPIEAISQALGSKHVVGYFVNQGGRCDVTVMVEELWDPNNDTPKSTAARLRFNLKPNESAALDTSEGKSISLVCGDNAETLAMVRAPEALTFNLK